MGDPSYRRKTPDPQTGLQLACRGYGDDPARICIVKGKCPLLGANELSDELTANRIQYGGVWYDVLWTAINPDYFPLENSDKELSVSKLNGIFKSGPLPPDVVLLIKQKEAFIFWFPGYTGPNPIGIDVVSDK